MADYVAGWSSGLPETACGYGSRLSSTAKQRQWMPEIISKYQIKTIADIGAGDLNWIKKTDLCGADYTPYDLVPRVPGVVEFDIIKQPPPDVDLIMCLWVLNHFSDSDCQSAIRNLMRSKYLMVTYKKGLRGIDLPYIESMAMNGAEIRLIDVTAS